MKINTFDIDGVIYMGEEFTGVRPCRDDIIITGRPQEEFIETQKMLKSRGIYNLLYMNPLKRTDPDYSRESSGRFKAKTINTLIQEGYNIGMHFEDDLIQIKEIHKVHPTLDIIHMKRPDDILNY
jgi:hypothetical protein